MGQKEITFIGRGIVGYARFTRPGSPQEPPRGRIPVRGGEETPPAPAEKPLPTEETAPAGESSLPEGDAIPAGETAPEEEAPQEGPAPETHDPWSVLGAEARRDARELRQLLETDLQDQKEALLALRQQENACLEQMQSLRRQLLELLSGPPLEELAHLSRNMSLSNDPEVLAFRQQVDRILAMFGAEAFAPEEGEPFDARRCERFSPDLGREVAECRSPGWACGGTVLLRAVVITR